MESSLPACHVCGAPPANQWMRLATAEEADAQRAHITELQGGRVLSDEEILARYGPLRTAVTGCAEHSFADGGGYDGGAHRAALHDADCTGHGNCMCAGVAA